MIPSMRVELASFVVCVGFFLRSVFASDCFSCVNIHPRRRARSVCRHRVVRFPCRGIFTFLSLCRMVCFPCILTRQWRSGHHCAFAGPLMLCYSTLAVLRLRGLLRRERGDRPARLLLRLVQATGTCTWVACMSYAAAARDNRE